MKKQTTKNSNEVDQRAIKKLFKASDTAAKKNQLESFLKGLLTDGEQLMLGRRLLIAELLLLGQTQAEIIYNHKISPNTVWRINRWLIGEFPEYGKVLKEIKNKQKIDKEGYDYGTFRSFTFAQLKKKYPAHFLFFNLTNKLLQ